MDSRAQLISAVAASVVAVGVAAQTPDHGAIWEGSFTQAQVDRGESTFNGTGGCASCHGFSGALDGNRDMFPPLAGEAFLRNMTGRPVAYLHDYVRNNKPTGDPGSLQADTVLALTAYILSQNGFPVGEIALTGERAAGLVIGPNGWNGVLPDSALVRVVGCLTEGLDGDWVVDRATAPLRGSDGLDPGVVAVPLGDDAFTLRFVLTPLDELAGHRVWVLGTLVGDGGADGISVSQVESLGDRCE